MGHYYLTITKKPIAIASAENAKAVEVKIDDEFLVHFENLIKEAIKRLEDGNTTAE